MASNTVMVSTQTAVLHGHATIRTATHAQMVRSRLNVRQKGSGKLTELAALIKAFGLLQNLVGFQPPPSGDVCIPVHIVAGGRRLDAIGLLIAGGDLPEDFAIPYLLVTEEEAVAISLAENLGREPMHHTDVVECMRELAVRGASPEDIGYSFGVDALTVKRRLKLANVSPRLFAMYRNDEINTEQMIAFAVADDHAAQEQAWDSLDPWSRKQAHAIRRLLVAQHIDITSDRVALFVGLTAFERAGGKVVRDLFSESGEGYIEDGQLLERQAVKKLEQVAAPLLSQGMSWVDVIVRADPAALAEYAKVRKVRSEPSPEQARLLGELETQLANWEDDGGEAGETAEVPRQPVDIAAVRRRQTQLEAELQQELASDLALAGAVVTIDRRGEAVVLVGMIRPADRSKMEKIAGQTEATSTSGGKRPRAVHSERLIAMLASQRTAALAAELVARPDIALVVLAHALAKGMLDTMEYGTGIAHISHALPMLGPEVKDSAAGKVLSEKMAEWKERAQQGRGGRSMFAWLLSLEREALLDLVAVAVASTLDTASMGETPSQAYVEPADVLDLDMRHWWTPTASSYFLHVTKERIVEVVGAAVSPDAALPLAQLQKAACASW
jgi:ParB family chromosome partitioning protein